MENELIEEYKEQNLIDDRILFSIGILELTSTKDGEVTLGESLGAFERINAIGLNENTIRGFFMEYSHLKSLFFEINFDQIVNLSVVKKLFGKVIFKIQTEDKYFEYKITANKEKIFEIEKKYLEYKEMQNV